MTTAARPNLCQFWSSDGPRHDTGACDRTREIGVSRVTFLSNVTLVFDVFFREAQALADALMPFLLPKASLLFVRSKTVEPGFCHPGLSNTRYVVIDKVRGSRQNCSCNHVAKVTVTWASSAFFSYARSYFTVSAVAKKRREVVFRAFRGWDGVYRIGSGQGNPVRPVVLRRVLIRPVRVRTPPDPPRLKQRLF